MEKFIEIIGDRDSCEGQAFSCLGNMTGFDGVEGDASDPQGQDRHRDNDKNRQPGIL